MKNCKKCSQNFEITQNDRDFYNKVDVPEPTFCPDCRQQRRSAFRNEKNLYKRKCDLSGRIIISNYSPDKVNKVYGYDEWWGDDWDPLSYGQDFDLNRSFFDQFRELFDKVPRLYLYNPHSENSEYTNHCYYNKNCYLIFNAAYNEDVFYSTNLIVKANDCSDCLSVEKGELLYECMYIKNCSNSKYLIHCSNCYDSAFLYDCKGCSDCFMSTNLRNQKYYFENQSYSKEEYEKKINGFNLSKYSDLNSLKEKFINYVKENAIYKNLHIENSENSDGDYIFNSRNVSNTFYADKCEDSKYCYDALENKDCLDCYESSINCELQYECYACNESSSMKFCILCHFSHNLEYCDYCFNCKDSFGCIGLKKKQYCILNKQYTKEKYEELVPHIKELMKKTNEYGEFFPISMSPFGYNETVANEYYPLSENEVKSKNYKWKEKDLKEYTEINYKIAEDIADVPESITNEVLACEDCGKNYRIIPQELNLYKKILIPVPHKCFDCRHKDRLNFRNPRKLWQRKCNKCNEEIQSTYSSNRSEKVFCEPCYLKEIH